MNIELVDLWIAVAVGLGATLIMDSWAIFLKGAFNVPLPNYCFVGRWLCYMPDGIFYHASIGKAPEKPAECIIGWVAHYTTGVVFALSFVLLASPQWLLAPTLLPALGFGLATVAIPFFVMQPFFGLGIAASKAPNPDQARLRSLMNHAVFGVGLYVSALAISELVKVPGPF
jgi:hypothetical protein